MAASEGSGTSPLLSSCQCQLRRHEDTLRFLLLIPVLLVYLLAGAALFHSVERGPELAAQSQFRATFEALRRNVTASSGVKALEEMERLLQLQRTADRRGLLSGRPQWDLAGSFHFCCSVVSTIGERAERRGKNGALVGQRGEEQFTEGSHDHTKWPHASVIDIHES